MYRGGNWNNGSNAGVFYLNGNNSRSNVNTNIGFRAALALFVYFLRTKAQQKHQGKRDAFPGRQGQRYTLVLLYPDAATLNRWRAAIEKYLNEVLHLELNSKTTIGLVKHGITFVGCRIYPGYRKPTAQSVKKMKARMRYIAKEYEAGLIDFDAVDATMQSYFGLMSHCSTHGLQKWIEKNIIFKRKEMADIELPQEVTQWELNQF